MERDRPQPSEEPTPRARLDDALTRLETGIYQTFSEETFQRFLAAQALFHDYSARNVLLILAQQPDATRCASFATWKQLGRWVKKGERGIQIRVPLVSTVETPDPETGEVTVAEILQGFRLGHVFDVAQTDGKPLPAPPRPREIYRASEIGHSIVRGMTALLAKNGIQVVREPVRAQRGGALGYYDQARQTVGLERFLFADQAAGILLHEGTHALCGARSFRLGKAKAEMVAEGTAFVVADHFGLDTSAWSIAYSAGWAQEPQVVQDSLEAIKRASQLLTLGISQEMVTRNQPGQETGYGA